MRERLWNLAFDDTGRWRRGYPFWKAWAFVVGGKPVRRWQVAVTSRRIARWAERRYADAVPREFTR